MHSIDQVWQSQIKTLEIVIKFEKFEPAPLLESADPKKSCEAEKKGF